jgi:copper transport protein
MLVLLTPGTSWPVWARLGLLAVLAGLSSRLVPSPSSRPRLWTIAAILGLAVLLTISLHSHAAASGRPLAILIDWAHLAAMAAWIGGLLPLLLQLRRRAVPARILIPRFSRLALVCVATLGLTGLAAAVRQIGSWEALLTTAYGRALISKSAAFLVLIGLGAVNLLHLTPRLQRDGGGAQMWFGRTIPAEIVAAGLALALAAVMTGAIPAREAVQERARLGYVGAFQESGARVVVWLAPGRVGENEIVLDLELSGEQVADPPQVLFRLQAPDARLGPFEVQAARTGPGRVSARGSYLTMTGIWQLEVILRRAGANDIRRTFRVDIRPAAAAGLLVNPIPASPQSIREGGALYTTHCLACHGPGGRGDGPTGQVLRPPPADLAIHTAPGVHPDGQLFAWITAGYPGSAMPAYETLLTEAERWHLVNFIRTFGVRP